MEEEKNIRNYYEYNSSFEMTGLVRDDGLLRAEVCFKSKYVALKFLLIQ